MKKLKIMLSTACTIVVAVISINLMNPLIVEAKIVPGYEMIDYTCPGSGVVLDRCNYADSECDVSAQQLCP